MSDAGRRLDAFWHATPLHYAPHVLLLGRLLSQARLEALRLPIRPRATARRRDRQLGLDAFVHLSFTARTPLLADKRAKGFPHVLFEFDPAVADLPGAAFLPFNAKAWRHRDDFAPIRAPGEKAAFLEAWRRGRRFPSAELLVPGEVPLAGLARALHTAGDAETGWLYALRDGLELSAGPPFRASPDRFPPGVAADLGPHERYRHACLEAGRLLPPPDLPFD